MRCQCMKILEAIFSRLLFAVHGMFMVAVMISYTDNMYYIILLSGVGLLFIEMIVTLKVTKSGEWKWFSPMVFLYLCTIVPSFFVIELHGLEVRMNVTNQTNSECSESEYQKFSKEVQSVEELTILVLIIGRWLMPRGKMNRDQLAQLLLIYLALGADMLDILELMKEPSVKTNKSVTVIGLCLFTWALMQFTIVLIQTVPSSSIEKVDNERPQSSTEVKKCVLYCFASEVANLMISVVMQDGPFLIYRLYLVTREGVFNDSMIFFISKNILAVAIQVYRAVVFLCNENQKRKKQSQINLA
ncbi:Transmembrane protein 26-like [Pristimantis euphronides]